MTNEADPIETVRRILNKVDGKDANGNDNRFTAQLKVFTLGTILESSRDSAVSNGGRFLRMGAEKSFADYMGLKVSHWIQSLFR